MELSAEQLEVIRAASREIDFGQIIIKFTGTPHNVVDIVAEKTVRFHSEKAGPAAGEAAPRKGSGRY
jgi:acyl CoA:acetate/3-ketoacid CoA transferase beta subunit